VVVKHQLKHLFYTGGWKKFEEFWNIIINIGGLQKMLPLLELLLSDIETGETKKQQQPLAAPPQLELHY